MYIYELVCITYIYIYIYMSAVKKSVANPFHSFFFTISNFMTPSIPDSIRCKLHLLQTSSTMDSNTADIVSSRFHHLQTPPSLDSIHFQLNPLQTVLSPDCSHPASIHSELSPDPLHHQLHRVQSAAPHQTLSASNYIISRIHLLQLQTPCATSSTHSRLNPIQTPSTLYPTRCPPR